MPGLSDLPDVSGETFIQPIPGRSLYVVYLDAAVRPRPVLITHLADPAPENLDEFTFLIGQVRQLGLVKPETVIRRIEPKTCQRHISACACPLAWLLGEDPSCAVRLCMTRIASSRTRSTPVPGCRACRNHMLTCETPFTSHLTLEGRHS